MERAQAWIQAFSKFLFPPVVLVETKDVCVPKGPAIPKKCFSPYEIFRRGVACATVPVVLDATLGMIKGALSWLLGERKGKGEKKTQRLVLSRILN